MYTSVCMIPFPFSLFVLIMFIFSIPLVILIEFHYYLQIKLYPKFELIIINNFFSFFQNVSEMNILNVFNISLLFSYLPLTPINPYNHHHLVYITITTSKYAKLLEYCIDSLHLNNISKQIIIFSLDRKIEKVCRMKNVNSLLLNIPNISQMNHWEVLRLKHVFQYLFICLNCDVLFFDVDIIFYSNIQNDLIKTMKDSDFLIMDEAYKPRKTVNLNHSHFIFNTGFVFTQSSKATKIFYRKWILDSFKKKRISSSENQKRFNTIINQNGKIIDFSQNEQSIIYHFTFDGGFDLKIHFLNPIKYLNYCSMISMFKKEKKAHLYKIYQTLNYSKELNETNPKILHLACLNFYNKLKFISNMSLKEKSYDYHMNYLANSQIKFIALYP
ncbi:hypothetical protein M9Y10_036886 [Tritrichomonas musculus]|uniref:Nucleotide-diphospho-sugar transferase domain-containing protein n=1 Tax=Tritrichomonas musculus TaxID=1915356 RepID=A0ABR2GT90_9EUKA